ncbi:alpha-amylase family glycosyl hydrolase [Flavobacterium sp.]|uniref:alpha-amylase family glycosyl hydrolase n=1 Tax=Flavobacterium sp. TaxID=239 RepID=UPI0039E5ED1D
MKKITILTVLFVLFAISGFAQVTTVPTIPEANQAVTINFNKSGTGLATYNGTVYAHIGLTVNGNLWQNVIGNWGNNTLQPALSGSGNSQSLTISPDLYTYFGVSTSAVITQICVVFRSADGAQQTSDFFLNVGAFQATLNAPALNSTTIINSGQNLNISASNTNGSANYNLLANGVSINTASGSSYNFTDTNITTNKSYELQITQGATSFTRRFAVMINPGTISQALPSASLLDGINYNSGDATKATLVLDAPNKDFVYVAGSFNNYQPNTSYAMKKDPSSTKFWLELTGLTPGQIYHYQYWVVDATPIANSPALVKTADPYSTLVLSPFDDQYIPASSYPNLPAYPAGQEREVTVLQTGQTPYNWQVTNFVKPKKEDLVVYEVLIRDFDVNRNFQDLINRIDYFKNLKINAIELMPVMEFEGNESWGYNTAFHMALDKFYGTENKFREFIDLCHQNGIAVILDVALNHAFGRNPMNRMWMNDPDGDGWGGPSSENPYFNQTATHAYGVGNDFNHQQARTKNYVKRVVKHWVEDFHIDGFRWDLTKGFTQNCTSGDEGCTGSYQQDRVDVLKEYADYSWSLDPNHYVIFEHLGADNEEKEWANYRLTENPSKGVMMWAEMTYAYSQLAGGYAVGGDITRIGHTAHAGFNGKRVMGYPESHDKERIMYSAMTYGNAAGAAPPFNNLNNSLTRMSTVGATSLLVPGPKMIWHFADLGMQLSIYTCNNGSVNTESDPTPGDCKLDTKPQPQWSENWLANVNRAKVYNDWAKLIAIKIQEPVFEGNYAISPNGNNVRQRIYIYDDALPSTQLKNVVVLSNYSVAVQSVTPDFPYTGTWYNLMDNTPLTVTSTSATISIQPGQFLVYGNKPVTLNTDQFETRKNISLYPNPSASHFTVNTNVNKLEIYSVAGQLVKTFGPQSDQYEYNVSDLTSGVYLVKLTDATDRSQTIKLIKQ